MGAGGDQKKLISSGFGVNYPGMNTVDSLLKNITEIKQQAVKQITDLADMLASLEKVPGLLESIKTDSTFQKQLARFASASSSTTAPATPARRGRPPGKAKPEPKVAGKSKRKFSPAARAKIAASAKARWAKAKAAGKNRL